MYSGGLQQGYYPQEQYSAAPQGQYQYAATGPEFASQYGGAQGQYGQQYGGGFEPPPMASTGGASSTSSSGPLQTYGQGSLTGDGLAGGSDTWGTYQQEGGSSSSANPAGAEYAEFNPVVGMPSTILSQEEPALPAGEGFAAASEEDEFADYYGAMPEMPGASAAQTTASSVSFMAPGMNYRPPPGMEDYQPGSSCPPAGERVLDSQFHALSLNSAQQPSADQTNKAESYPPAAQQSSGGMSEAADMYPRPSPYQYLARPELPIASATQAPIEKYGENPYHPQCLPEYMRMTVRAIPNSPQLLNQWRLPFGVIVHPMAPTPEGAPEIPLVDFGTNAIIRCRRCRTYINPFITFADQGRRWQCNVCKFFNEVPMGYYSPLDQTGKRKDILSRPELMNGSCEFVANEDYMVRPPPPPVYVFVLDVSAGAVSSGFFRRSVLAIRTVIEELSSDDRVQVGFITFDNTLHFYHLKRGGSVPHMIVLPNVEEVFLPVPDDLLYTLKDNCAAVMNLLDKFDVMFTDNSATDIAFGSAVRGARELMRLFGGKMLCFLSGMPSVGLGALKSREDPSLFGTDKEKELYIIKEAFYRDMAFVFSRDQISCELFLGANSFLDIPTIGVLSKFTTGGVHYFAEYDDARDGAVLESRIKHVVCRETGFEAVMRVRASTGVRIHNFHGNFLIRGQDLMAVPNIDSDKSFALEFTCANATVNAASVCVQCALLYTSFSGERRIRVHTLTVPVCSNLTDMYQRADSDASVSLLAKIAAERFLQVGSKLALEEALTRTLDTLKVYRRDCSSAPLDDPQLYLPETFTYLPLMCLALLKNPTFLASPEVSLDQKICYHFVLSSSSVSSTITFLLPRMIRLDTVEERENPLMDTLPLARLSLSSDGCYLLDDGYEIILWVGRQLPGRFYEEVFGMQLTDLTAVPQEIIPSPERPLSVRVCEVLDQVRAERSGSNMPLTIVQEGSHMEYKFLLRLVEDKFGLKNWSYGEFLNYIFSDIQSFLRRAR